MYEWIYLKWTSIRRKKWTKQPQGLHKDSPQYNLTEKKKKKENLWGMKTLKSRFTSLWLCLACQHRISCCLMKYNSSVISSLWLALPTVGSLSLPWEPF